MMTTAQNPLSHDLDHIVDQTIHLWEKLRNQRIFITGGTGFFGCWLLESFIWANQKLNLNAHAVILTRNINSFAKKCPHLVSHTALEFVEGDVSDFDFPAGEFACVIHAATDVNTTLCETNPLSVLDTIVEGTRHTLEFARAAKTKHFLLVSSGAVYGKQPSHIEKLSEEHLTITSFIDAKSVYAAGKCTAEHISCLYAKQYGLDIKIARCFAFVGPYLPLDGHFAIGNFIRDGLNGKSISVKGDGTTHRSYLYAADLAIWLWTILFNGKTLHPYNVGSNEALSISELADRVAKNFEPNVAVDIMRSPSKEGVPERYVPDISRAENELGLTQKISLDQALQSTIKWHLSS